MSEPKDPAIKLFGKTIPLQEIAGGSGIDSSVCGDHDPCCADRDDGEEREVNTDVFEDGVVDDGVAGVNENPKTPSNDNESATLKSSRTADEQSDTGISEEKTLKKPDKIIPCPRCDSMDTKFCYYNNYNVNQPRHFCKNCQRYWTAGGTMRNVPVGAGRRKNKNSASQYRQITVSESLQNSQPSNIPNGIHHPTLKPNGAVLAFGSDSPLCESMASALSLAEKNMMNGTRNGFIKPEELKIPVSYESNENGADKMNGSSITASNSNNELMQDPQMMQNFQGYPHQIPCFPGGPWPYPWNPAQWNPLVPPPGFCPSGYPMPFYPPPTYWGWNIPLMPHPSSNPHYSNSGPTSPLGKHSREDEEELVKPNNSGKEPSKDPKQSTTSEKCLWVPKTLRIDDPGEAAKSSIWETLGIKNEMAESIGGRGLFKAFQSKGHEKNHTPNASSVLQANPAALCRSLNFQEST